MTLDETSQTELMHLITEILQKSDIKQSADVRDNSFEYHKGNTAEKTNNFLIGKSENKENKLLQKLEELENENLELNSKYDEIIDENEKHKSKIDDLNLEVLKKTEEIRHLYSYKEQLMNQVIYLLDIKLNFKKLSVQEVTEDLQNELKFKDRKITELNKYIEEIRQGNEVQLMHLKA